jgi:hypothetical protein
MKRFFSSAKVMSVIENPVDAHRGRINIRKKSAFFPVSDLQRIIIEEPWMSLVFS